MRRFIAAANANDTVPKYLRSGRFEPQPSVRTVANAMDVGNPSNFERIVDLFGNDFSAVTARIGGYSCDDQTILEAIRELYDRYGYLSDPHSAVGYKAACEFGIEGFWLSTAHGSQIRRSHPHSAEERVSVTVRTARTAWKGKAFHPDRPVDLLGGKFHPFALTGKTDRDIPHNEESRESPNNAKELRIIRSSFLTR